jgi:cell division GTPase FtsZ
VVDSDVLLKREMVTLTEALMTTNNVVLLAILAVSTLVSDSHMKVLDIIPDDSKVVSTSDVLNILQHSDKAAIGFGAGFSVKASVERAAFDCLFLSGSLIQEENNVVISVTSSQTMDKRDIQAVVRAFRQIAKSSAQIICSTILETALEPNVIVSTIIVTGIDRHVNFWSQLSLSLPFPFSLFQDGLSLKSTVSQPSLLPEKDSCSEEALSTRRSTLKNVSMLKRFPEFNSCQEKIAGTWY